LTIQIHLKIEILKEQRVSSKLLKKRESNTFEDVMKNSSPKTKMHIKTRSRSVDRIKMTSSKGNGLLGLLSDRLTKSSLRNREIYSLFKKSTNKSYSTKLNFFSISKTTEVQLIEAMDKIFNSKSLKGWILVGYETSRILTLQSFGENIEDLLDKLNEEEVQYILLRIPVYKSNQFLVARDIFITWIGSQVTNVEKGRKCIHVGEIKNYFQPYHSELTAISKNNFTLEEITKLSSPFSGSHVLD